MIGCKFVENPGDAPKLRPGDVVKVQGHIGVIAEASVIVDGTQCLWDRVPPVKRSACLPSYSIAFRSIAGLRSAWWHAHEIDEVVTLGPFHEREEWNCVNCGLPTAINPHPNAGEPNMMNWIGVVHVCVPCAEQRANGRRMLIERLRRWLEEQREATCGWESNSFDLALGKLQELKEWFRLARLGRRSPDYESTEEPPAYRWKKGGLIWRIVAPSRVPGYVIAQANDGSVASFAESVFQDPNVVEPISVVNK